jgi:hypothetical protein
MFLQTSYDGELEVDHRASPGLTENQALRLNYDPKLCGEGKIMRTATLGCPHCGSVVVINPLRTRERAHCMRCCRYICDWCKAAMDDPDYTHLTMAEIREKVSAGTHMVIGSSMHKLKLVPIGDQPNV